MEIQGTVVDYMNIAILKIARDFPGSYIVHNGHDSIKYAFPQDRYDPETTFEQVQDIVEGSLTWHGLTVKVTSSGKIIYP